MTSATALRKRWNTLAASIEGRDRNKITDKQWLRFHDIIDKAALVDAAVLEADVRLNYCFLKLYELPDAVIEGEIKQHLARSLALMKGRDVPHLNILAHQIQAILHLAAGDLALARESRAQMWDSLPDALKLSLHRIRFDYQWNEVYAKVYKPFAVDGFELAQWLFAKRDAIRKEDMFSIGGYVTNNREFYAEVEGIARDLERKLASSLAKPENYVLRGDPGSGKSFLVEQLAQRLKLPLIPRNLSSYRAIDEARSSIISDVISALLSKERAFLFIDEADTSVDGINLFQGFIAPMNGEQFIHMDTQFSFKNKNLVIFYAMSSEEKKWRTDETKAPQKWLDFIERVPADHWMEPPAINSSAGERVFRAIGLLNGMAKHVKYAHANALFYIGWKDWKSTRELELSLRTAVSKISPPNETLVLSDICPSQVALDEVENDKPTRRLLDEDLGAQGKSLWSFGRNRKIRIAFA